MSDWMFLTVIFLIGIQSFWFVAWNIDLDERVKRIEQKAEDE